MLLMNLFGAHCAMAADWANKSRYRAANERLSSMVDTTRIVMMGNSITEYWEELHPRFFIAHHLVGRGISGQVSSQMLARFRQDVINLNPRVVVINCGTNDIAENNGLYDEDITMDNIMSMTELAQAHGIQVILSSVLPADGFIWNAGVKDAPSKITSLNKRIIDYCSTKGLPYIDYYSVMVTTGGALNASWTDDGVHPNIAGYHIMEKQILDKLDELDLNFYNK